MGYLCADLQLWGKHGFDSKRLTNRNQSVAGALFAAAAGPVATQRLRGGQQQQQQQQQQEAAASLDAVTGAEAFGEAEAGEAPHPMATLVELAACAVVAAGTLVGASSRLTASAGILAPPPLLGIA